MDARSNRTSLRRLVLAATVLTLPAVGMGTHAAARPATAPPVSTAPGFDLDEAVARAVGDAPGGTVALVVRDGEATIATAGVANAAGDPMTPETVFRIGSLTKPFVATLVLQLVDEGLVDLDAPLSTYLPDTPVGGDVAIRDLLRHRSGVPDFTEADGFVDLLLADPDRAFTPADIVGLVADVPAGEPDREYAYSNTNFVLLGQLVEQVVGSDLATVLRERITDPLGLTVTHLATADEAAIDRLAGGWSPDIPLDGDPAAPYGAIASMAWSAGGLVSTVGELRTFLEGLFGGDLMSAAALAEMTTTEPDEYGLGIGVLVLPSGAQLFGHNGDIFGYLSLMAIEPVSGNLLVILTNNNDIEPFAIAEELISDW